MRCCLTICIFFCNCIPELPSAKYCQWRIVESSLFLRLFHLGPYNGIALLLSPSKSTNAHINILKLAKKSFVTKNGPKMLKIRHFFDFSCKKFTFELMQMSITLYVPKTTANFQSTGKEIRAMGCSQLCQ